MTRTHNGALVVLDPSASYSVSHTTPTLSGQATSVYIPSSDPGYPPVVLCHQASGDQLVGDDVSPTWSLWSITDYLSRRGFVVAASNLHGDSWGNDTGTADIENLLAHIDANSNADVSRVFIVGLSMGMITACCYVQHGAAEVLAIASLVGCCDLGYMHDTAGFATSIDTAYTNHAGYLAAFNTHDPQTIAESGALDDIPIAMWWGSADVTVGATETQTFLNTAPLAESFGETGAHFGIALLHGPTVGSFFIRHLPQLAKSRTLLV